MITLLLSKYYRFKNIKTVSTSITIVFHLRLTFSCIFTHFFLLHTVDNASHLTDYEHVSTVFQVFLPSGGLNESSVISRDFWEAQLLC